MKFTKDSMVQPIASEWFQFYAPNQDKVIQPLSENRAAVSSTLNATHKQFIILTTSQNFLFQYFIAEKPWIERFGCVK